MGKGIQQYIIDGAKYALDNFSPDAERAGIVGAHSVVIALQLRSSSPICLPNGWKLVSMISR